MRLFDVDINGTTVLSNFDVWSVAGGLNKGYVARINVLSPATVMTITFHHGVENPFLSGLEVVSLNDGVTAVPTTSIRESLLRQISPNPFRGRITIGFALAAPGHARLGVYDVSGRLTATILDRELPAGEQSVTWDGTGRGGTRVAPGIYFCNFQSGGRVETRRIVLLP
jgi:hypothetical protein